MIIKQRARQMGRLIRSHPLEDPVSQLIWLASVGLFARWTQTHYIPPAGGVPWIGMTITTSIFAIWGQVARAWLAVRCWSRTQEQHNHVQGDL
ncbi:MAG: hypothetical protein ABIV47_22785 [Roseiflexaceae bacterium]